METALRMLPAGQKYRWRTCLTLCREVAQLEDEKENWCPSEDWCLVLLDNLPKRRIEEKDYYVDCNKRLCQTIESELILLSAA